MAKVKQKNILKDLGVDILMLFFFVLILSFTLWIIWMYYFREIPEIETRGYVSKTLEEVTVQPSDTDKYTLLHFHNLNETVLKGIEYPSTCVTCHGDYPHNKTPKVRAFFNAHSWFMACEVCHSETDDQKNVVYRWLDSDTDIPLSKLQGDAGMYKARIVPFLVKNSIERRLDNLISKNVVSAYELSKNSLSEDENKSAIKKMHQQLTEKPVYCDQCHTKNGLFNFKQLLYSDKVSMNLKAVDIGAMIKGDKDFHFPDLFNNTNKSSK